jgi:hypothetical protein
MYFYHPRKGYDCEIVDPDFDDALGDVALLQHEIAVSGRIELHPDGNRLSNDFDPVPLHTRVYPGENIIERVKREWAQHLEDLKRWKEEDEAREARQRERFGYGIATFVAEVAKPPEPTDPHERLLFNMKLDKPIAKGQGRVWNEYVMVNETDLLKWGEDRTRRQLAEVWRGQGFVIFRLR